MFNGKCTSTPQVLVSAIKANCECVNNYAGARCELDNFFCVTEDTPCLNGGECLPGTADTSVNADRSTAYVCANLWRQECKPSLMYPQLT